jgi:outer membrane immunogenic protein
MKKVIVAAAFLASTAASGAAPAAAAPGWTGSYGGIEGGWGWGSSSQTDTGIPVFTNSEGPSNGEGPTQDGHYGVRGGLVGATLGSNWQKGSWVYGVEGDFSWSDLRGSSNVCGPLTATPHPCGTNLDALGTFRGRLGYAAGANGNWLLYATGGLAIGDIHGWDALTPASGSVWRAGWTVGAGIETVIAPNWTAKVEYLYVDLGNGQVFNVVPGISESVGLTANIIRAGINYKFGGPGVAPSPLYTKAPYTKAPVMAGNPWSGWYAGLNAGYLDGSSTINTDAVVISSSTTLSTAPAMAAGATSQLSTGNGGFIGGGQVGYNWALSPKLVAGFEADIQSSSLRNSATATTVSPAAFTGFSFLTNIAASRSVDYIGTVRARLGATVIPDMLLYVTGGLAYGGVKSNTTIGQSAPGSSAPATAAAASFSDTRAGYTVGAGGEWLFAPKWSLKAEYLYYDLGSANYGTGNFGFDEGPTNFPGFGVAAVGSTTHVHFNGNIVRAGINYHLN